MEEFEMDYDLVKDEVLWILENYGSDAEEAKNPGSKKKAQAARIVEFIRQLNEASYLLEANNLDLIGLKRIGG